MATKTITVTENAYDFLCGIKKENESFSHLLIRLAKEKGIADKYFGILKEDNINETRTNLKKIRKNLSGDFARREKVFTRH